MRTQITIEQIDTELPNCLQRLRNARIRRDKAAEVAFQQQLNTLIEWRHQLAHPERCAP